MTSSLRGRAGLVAFVVVCLAPLPVWSADPSSGTLSRSNPSIAYSSGPFAVSNPTTAETGECPDETVSCDFFELTVDFSGVEPSKVVTITTAWDNGDEDFDVYLLDPDDGSVVKQSAGSANPEIIVVAVGELTKSAYRIRIVPYLVAGGTANTVIQLGTPVVGDPCEATGAQNTGAAALSAGVARALVNLPADTFYGAFVHFSKDTPAQHRALLEGLGLKVVADFERHASAVYATGPLSAFRALVKERSVSYLEENTRLEYHGDTASWVTRARVAQEAVAGGPYTDRGGQVINGAGATIAIVDSGVNVTHPDFAGRVVRNFKIVGDDDTTGGLAVEDLGPSLSSDTTGGHGTHVAGIALGSGAASTGDYPVESAAPNTRGTYTGVAPGASLVAYGAGETLLVLTSATAFQHIIDHYDEFTPRIRAVSNSYGFQGDYDPFAVMACLTKDIIKKGASVLFSAGNRGGNGASSTTSPYCQDPTPGVVCVANYDDQDMGTLDGALDSSSSRGTRGRPETYPDIAAPGSLYTAACAQHQPGQAVCTGPDTNWAPYYGTISGTSMATPHVAGALALLYQARPELTPGQAEDAIQDTARKVVSNGRYEADPQNAGNTTNVGMGAGLLNVQAALDKLGVSHGVATAPSSETTVIDGDEDSALPGAEDVVRLTVREATAGVPGMTYRITVRGEDGADGTSYTLEQSVNGLRFVTRIDSTATGVTSPEAGLENTAPATSASRSGNVITFFVPYSNLGHPPAGGVIHNIRVLSTTDYAPSPSDAIDPALQPMFGKPVAVSRHGGLPPPRNPCAMPGVTVVTDANGDADPAAYDIQSLHIGEPGNLHGQLVFTMKVADLSVLPPNSLWIFRFDAEVPPENGHASYWVGMSTVGGSARFVHGTAYTQSAQVTSVAVYEIAGEIDQERSSYAEDGTITMVADRALFAAQPGSALYSFIGTTRPVAQDEGPIAGGSQDTAEGGYYYLVGNGSCAGSPDKQLPSGSGLLLGSLGLPALLLLGFGALLRRRARLTI